MTDFLHHIKKEIKELSGQIKTLRRVANEAEIKLKALQAAKAAYINAGGKEIFQPQGASKESRTDKIERILRKAGTALHYKEIVKRLKEDEEYIFLAKNPYSATTATLSMGRQFKSKGNGMYTLSQSAWNK